MTYTRIPPELQRPTGIALGDDTLSGGAPLLVHMPTAMPHGSIQLGAIVSTAVASLH